METKYFPCKLKSLRRSIGYSRKKVARTLGLADPSSLSKWERGLVLPGLRQTFRLAHMYNVLPHELLHGLWNDVQSDKSLPAHDDEPLTNNKSFYL